MIQCKALIILSSAWLVAGCAAHRELARSPTPRIAESQADPLFSALLPWVDKALAAGPPYGWDELNFMDRANKLGPEGQDASALFDDERKRHFKARRERILGELRAEIARQSEDQREDLLLMAQRRAAPASDLPLHNSYMRNWSIYDMEALRNAHKAASCAAFSSTSRAWYRKYPERKPFRFRRFKGSRAWMRYAYCPNQRHRPKSPHP